VLFRKAGKEFGADVWNTAVGLVVDQIMMSINSLVNGDMEDGEGADLLYGEGEVVISYMGR
jgi:hypothetical protein